MESYSLTPVLDYLDRSVEDKLRELNILEPRGFILDELRQVARSEYWWSKWLAYSVAEASYLKESKGEPSHLIFGQLR